jgi:hypothetical protein
LRSIVVLAALAAAPALARAEVHGTVAGGGLLRFDALGFGFWAAAEVWPGGLWGARLDLDATTGPVLVEASVARALGATWRHLVVSIHGGAGADLADRGVSVAVGLASEVGLGIGPLGLAGDLTTHLVVWDGRRDLVVTAALGVAAVF